MNIVITESATEDILSGYFFYESQYNGLGDYFESSIFTDIRSLILFSGIHEVHFSIYFRKLAKHFPYAIYYTIVDNEIRVHAVIDTRRDPDLISQRLEKN